MRADRRNACDSRARLDPQRPALDVKVRTRCGRKTLLSRDRVALLLSVARSKASRWPLAAFVPESIEMEDLWADCRLRALSTTLLRFGYTGPSTATGARICAAVANLDNHPATTQVTTKSPGHGLFCSIQAFDGREKPCASRPRLLLETLRGLLGRDVTCDGMGDRGLGRCEGVGVLPGPCNPNPPPFDLLSPVPTGATALPRPRPGYAWVPCEPS